MRVTSFNLKHLRGFAAVAEIGNVTAAAEKVALSQPALTQALTKLERQVGQSLFDRRNNGFFLSPAGTVLLRRVNEALSELSNGVRGAVRRARRQGDDARPFETMVTLTQLRALLAVATARNFTLAARMTGLTQPSIHKAAKDLEQIAGFQCYVKTPEGIDLTRPAQELADRTNLMFKALRNGIEELDALLGNDTGEISVGTLPLARSNILPNTIGAYLDMYPKASIRVHDGLYSDLLGRLRIGEIEMLVGALRDDLPLKDVEQRLLFDDPLSVVARPGHPLAQATGATWDDLVRYSWVLPRKETPTRGFFDDCISEYANGTDVHVIETSSLAMIRSLLSGSDRLAITSAHQIKREEELGLLTRIPFDLGGVSRRIGVTTRVGWQPTTSQAKFYDVLVEQGGMAQQDITDQSKD